MIIINLKAKQMEHTKRLEKLIDFFTLSENVYMLKQLEVLKLEIERDIIQTKYDTIDECYEKINR